MILVRFKRVITPIADGDMGKDIVIRCRRKYELLQPFGKAKFKVHTFFASASLLLAIYSVEIKYWYIRMVNAVFQGRDKKCGKKNACPLMGKNLNKL